MANPTDPLLVSIVTLGLRPNSPETVRKALTAEIKERVDTVAGKASLSGATFTGAVRVNSTLTVTGTFTTSGKVNLLLTDYPDDTAAAAGGVALGQLYRNGSVVQVRTS